MIILLFVGVYLAAVGLAAMIVLTVLVKQFVNFSNSIEGKETMTYWNIRVPRFCMFIAMRIMEIGEKMELNKPY